MAPDVTVSALTESTGAMDLDGPSVAPSANGSTSSPAIDQDGAPPSSDSRPTKKKRGRSRASTPDLAAVTQPLPSKDTVDSSPASSDSPPAAPVEQPTEHVSSEVTAAPGTTTYPPMASKFEYVRTVGVVHRREVGCLICHDMVMHVPADCPAYLTEVARMARDGIIAEAVEHQSTIRILQSASHQAKVLQMSAANEIKLRSTIQALRSELQSIRSTATATESHLKSTIQSLHNRISNLQSQLSKAKSGRSHRPSALESIQKQQPDVAASLGLWLPGSIASSSTSSLPATYPNSQDEFRQALKSSKAFIIPVDPHANSESSLPSMDSELEELMRQAQQCESEDIPDAPPYVALQKIKACLSSMTGRSLTPREAWLRRVWINVPLPRPVSIEIVL